MICYVTFSVHSCSPASYIHVHCRYSRVCICTYVNHMLCFTVFPGYQPALSLVSHTTDFSERFSSLNYSFQESCSLYPRCTPYFSVEHTVSPQSVVSNTSSGCSVEYTILNLMRCVSYQSTATALLGNQSGNTVVMGTTVMLSEWGGRASRLDNTNNVITSVACYSLHTCECCSGIGTAVLVATQWTSLHMQCVHGGDFLRSRSIQHHQCLHWSRQWPHQCDLHGSKSCYYI